MRQHFFVKNQWQALTVIAVAVLFSLSLWFSASAVLPQLKQQWNINMVQGSFITTFLQLGFIAGALTSAFIGFADKYKPRTIFIVSSILGAFLNALFIFSPSFEIGLALRFFTGVSLAGVYPIAVKLVSLWFDDNKGVSMGILIAGLTLGSALPHLVSAFPITVSWEVIILISSVFALSASFLIGVFLPEKTDYANEVEETRHSIKVLLKNRKVMLANYGYWFHMWELYAMWTWLPYF